jgi:hypothetical protein
VSSFRIVDKRHLAPYVPPPAPRPRQVLCYEVLPCPDVHDSRRCYERAGHEGVHPWELCTATLSIDRHADDDVQCDLQKGHDQPMHRFTVEWTDQDFGASPR